MVGLTVLTTIYAWVRAREIVRACDSSASPPGSKPPVLHANMCLYFCVCVSTNICMGIWQMLSVGAKVNKLKANVDHHSEVTPGSGATQHSTGARRSHMG